MAGAGTKGIRLLAAGALLLWCAGAQAAPGMEEAQALAARAVELQALGFRQKAIEHLEAALERAGDPKTRIRIRGALGQAYLRAGQLDRASPHVEEAVRGGSPAALNDLGQLRLAQGRKEEAAKAFGEAIRASDEPLVVAAAATSLAGLGIEVVRNLERADRALAQAADSTPADFARVRQALAWGRSADGRRLEKAFALLQDAMRASEARNDWVAHSHASGHLGELYAEEGRPQDALALTRRAVFAAQRAQADEALYRWSWQAARLLAKAGEREAAIAAYRRSLASLQAVRQDLILELRAARRSWREAVGPLHLEYADLMLRRAPGETVPQARLVEVRDVVEQLKAVELEDYFQDECVAGQLARQKDIDRIEPATAVLYPVVLPDRLEMLVGLSDGIRQVTLPIGAGALSREALGFRRLLEKRTTNQFMPYARRLYAAIFAPVEPLLAERGVRTIVFIPDGPLRGIPVSALWDGKGFLVERYAFATAPGLTLVEPQALAGREDIRVLVNGITESVQNFPALPFVREEMDHLRKLFADGRFLSDAEFRVPSFEAEVKGRPYSIVHIASHGEFDSDPKKSFVLAYDGRLSMDSLEQVMKLARFRDDPVELLTLSACRTAAGDDRASLGLAGVAVKAGARSALATLWYVNDQASSLLVSDFYRRLPGTSKARALQEAQRAVIADPRFRHPGYWAPFLLIGNWL